MSNVRARIRNAFRHLPIFGLDPFKFIAAIRILPAYFAERRRFLDSFDGGDTRFLISPFLHDRAAPGGMAGGHYFHQDLMVARKIYRAAPTRHVDVGSRVDGFVAHLAVFRPVTVIDVRPTRTSASNIDFLVADVSGDLPDSLIACCDSLSSLHAIEHFGLGRYGDPIDPKGHEKGLENFWRILQDGGTLYLSVPIGPSRIEFNEQRVFSLRELLALLTPRFRVTSFSFVDDSGDIHEDIPLDESLVASNAGCNYGCGILELVKVPRDTKDPGETLLR